MVPPTPTTSPEKDIQGFPTMDEKEMETDHDEHESPNLAHLRSASSRPITPAKFLENMSKSKVRNKQNDGQNGDDEDVPVFSLGNSSVSPNKEHSQQDTDDDDDEDMNSPIMAPVWDKENVGNMVLNQQDIADDLGVNTQKKEETPFMILDKGKIESVSKLFDLDGDGVEKLLNETEADTRSQSMSDDLCVYGTGIAINSAAYPTTDEDHVNSEDEEVGTPIDSVDEHKEYESPETVKTLKTPKTKKWIRSLDAYIPERFKGVDVKKWSEWTECIDFSKQNGIVVVEVYSVVFGPSNAMYPFVAEIVNQRADCVKFVRLSLHTMSTMEVVHETIKDHQHYYPSPEPMYLIIKNGKQVGQLKGTKPAELSTLIEKHMAMKQRAATVPVSPVSVKYRSILKQKSPGKRTSSSMFATPRKQVPVTVRDRGENIRNLLRESNSGLMSCGSEHSSPTRLWKNEMVLVD